MTIAELVEAVQALSEDDKKEFFAAIRSGWVPTYYHANSPDPAHRLVVILRQLDLARQYTWDAMDCASMLAQLLEGTPSESQIGFVQENLQEVPYILDDIQKQVGLPPADNEDPTYREGDA